MGTFTSFGTSIPVTGPNIGFPGTVSRFGERVISARPFAPLVSTNNLNFGDPAVLVPNSTANLEDSYDSVKDFLGTLANTALLKQYFAGAAVREVKTQLGYPQTPGVLATGYYASGQMAEVLERGTMTVYLSVGAPRSQDQVYTRVVANGGVMAGTIGDWETDPAASDLFTLAVGTGGAAAGQKVIPVASTTNVQVGQLVSGPGGSGGSGGESSGIPAGAYVASLIANTSITLNVNLTAALVAGQVMTLSNLFAIPNCVARTGFLDANNALEITFKNRLAA